MYAGGNAFFENIYLAIYFFMGFYCTVYLFKYSQLTENACKFTIITWKLSTKSTKLYRSHIIALKLYINFDHYKYNLYFLTNSFLFQNDWKMPLNVSWKRETPYSKSSIFFVFLSSEDKHLEINMPTRGKTSTKNASFQG